MANDIRSRVDVAIKSRIAINSIYDYPGLLDEIVGLTGSQETNVPRPTMTRKWKPVLNQWFFSNNNTVLRFSALLGRYIWDKGYRYTKFEYDANTKLLKIIPRVSPTVGFYRLYYVQNRATLPDLICSPDKRAKQLLPRGRFYRVGEEDDFTFKWEGEQQ